MMRALLLLTAATGLVACAETADVTRAAGPGLPDLLPGVAAVAPAMVQVVVPEGLRVSERDGFYPQTDIVWRGEAAGDRHAQVAAILNEAAMAALPQTTVPGTMALITVERFHGVTPAARSVTPGVYSIRFQLQFVDTATGMDLRPAEVVALEVPGPSAADLQGTTERDWLVAALAGQLAARLAPPIDA
jgi:hypothetical protein